MHLIIQPTDKLTGRLTPPSSKSHTIRGIISALLCKGESTLSHFLNAEDTHDAIHVCEQLGAICTLNNNKLTINSQGLPFQSLATNSVIYTGNSGITTHFIMPLLGLRTNPTHPVILDCGKQMQTRPIHPLVNALRQVGLSIEYLNKKNFLPITLSGALNGGQTEVDGMTSQYLSALLFSLPCAPYDSEIIVKNLQERPYIDMTLAWLKMQNIQYTHQILKNYDKFFLTGNQQYKKFQTTIAADFSSASYLIAAAALTNSHVELTGLNMHDTQGDKQLVTLLQKMGADIQVTTTSLIIKGGKSLTGIDINMGDIPDLLPTLAVIGTKARGKTTLYNIQHTRLKETDRIHSITEGLHRLNAKIEESKDSIIIYPSQLQGTFVKGFGDHRTVMALSIAGLLAKNPTHIDDAEAIHKTFPSFIQTLTTLGANITCSAQLIILIGFKHVGKTTIGRALATHLKHPFIDLDQEIEKIFPEPTSCRDIMTLKGEATFREIEHHVFANLMKSPSSAVIALGGGTLSLKANQLLLTRAHKIIHLTAPKQLVFDRIMTSGQPAFFHPDVDPLTSFHQLWEERKKIYNAFASLSVDNVGTIESVVTEIVQKIT